MENKSEYPLSPQKPYDETVWDQFDFYDNIPYMWDSDNERQISLVSGNVIKGYRCKLKDSYELKY